MLSQTAKLKGRLKSETELEKKIQHLKDRYKGETLYILTCGPSLGSIEQTKLKTLLADKLVFTVKQAYQTYAEISDFHLFNTYNHQKYDYRRNPGCILVAGTVPDAPPLWGPCPDISFSVNLVPAQQYPELGPRLAVHCAFEEFTLENGLVRPWGPGIMYEVCFYLALHLGVKNCVVIGWDLAPPDAGSLPHYYDREKEDDDDANRLKVKPRRFPALLRLAGKALSFVIPKSLQELVKNRWDYERGKRYNRVSSILEGELEQIAGSSKKLFEWLKQKDVRLFLVSEESYLDSSIPRISLEEAVSLQGITVENPENKVCLTPEFA